MQQDLGPNVGPVETVVYPGGVFGVYLRALADVSFASEPEADGYRAHLIFNRVTIHGSPVRFDFDEPVAGMNEINPPALLAFLIKEIERGAIVEF